MGLFNPKSTTFVTSVAYPLGEDDGQHTPYLEYTMLNAVMQQRPIAESIIQGYLRGQGISLRSAFRYARDHYTDGVPFSNVSSNVITDVEAIRTVLESLYPGVDIDIFSSKNTRADFVWWGDQYLADNYGYDPFLGNFASPPAGVDVDAAVSYDIDAAGDITVMMVNADTSIVTETFTPVGFVSTKNFLHIAFDTKTTSVVGPTTTTRTADPGEVDHTTTTSVDLDDYTTQTTVVVTTVVAGTATDNTTVTTEYRSRPKFWMYQIGLGTYPTLDAWHSGTDLTSPYYPSIPIRVNNIDVTGPAYRSTDLYKTGKKILKKVGIDIKKIGEEVNDNPSIDDIDFAYVVFGVRLNAESQECKRYLYRFFKHLESISIVTGDDMAGWSPGSGTSAPTNALVVFSATNTPMHHDIVIQWQYIVANPSVSGSAFVGAKPGDVSIEVGAKDITDLSWNSSLDQTPLTAKRQIDADTYEQLDIVGLTYDNFVYLGKAVHINARDAFFAPEGETDPDDGFIIPLNYDIIHATPMVELTDLSYQCNHLVFNCYKIVKEKWYQTGLFKVIIVIIAILIIIYTWGSGTPAAAALLAEAFVAAGISLTLAIVLAATIYVLGVMILMNLLSKAAVDVFGEKWGPVIAIIISFIAMNWSSIAQMAGSVATNGIGSIITASTILQATTLLASAYGAYAAGVMTEIQKKSMGLWTDYDEQMKHIEELSKANLGTNLDMIDIQGYTDATFTQLFESYETFMSRTLLTGSEICAITSGMVTNFADVGLMLPIS